MRPPNCTSDEIGILEKLQEEQARTSEDSRIPRIRLQHQTNDDHHTNNKDSEDLEQNQTARETDVFLPMDSESSGEDYGNYSSGGERSPTCSVSSKGFSS